MGLRLFITLSIFFTGCQLVDQMESEPAYVLIGEVSVLNPDGNGTATQDVRDLWSYLNDQNLGIYPHPTHITCLPVPGVNKLSLLAGIRENGMASEVSVYPMLEALNYDLEMEAGSNYPINPVFQYRNDLFVRFDEGFEGVNHSWTYDADKNPSTQLKIINTNPKSGQYCAFLEVPDTLAFASVATGQGYVQIPTDGNAVYLELDYRGDCNLFVGLIGYADINAESTPYVSYYLGLKPKEDWTKIYVNLTSELFNSGLKSYRILLRAEHQTPGIPEGVYLDNLKLLHF